jgi:hypothetical protein
MAKMKLDLDQVKKFMIERGERVGLGLAVGIMALFLLMGIWTALASTSPDKAILKEKDALAALISRGGDGAAAPPPVSPPQWAPQLTPGRLKNDPYFLAAKTSDNKRRNPNILPVGRYEQDRLKDVQIDVVRGDFLLLQMDYERQKVRKFMTKGGKGPGGAGPIQPQGPEQMPFKQGLGKAGGRGTDSMVHKVMAQRVVVLSTVFPYSQQLEYYRRALRKETVNELFDAKEPLAPRFLGLNVIRSEVQPDGKFSPWQTLYTADANGKAVLDDKASQTKKLFVEGVYDTTVPDQVGYYIIPGLVTPVPRLADNASKVPFGHYPLLQLGDIKTTPQEVAMADNPAKKNPKDFQVKGPGPVFPNPKTKLKMPGGKGVPEKTVSTPQTDWVGLDDLAGAEKKIMRLRFNDKLAFFSPSGLPPSRKDQANLLDPRGPKLPPVKDPKKKEKDANDDDDDDDEFGPPGGREMKLPKVVGQGKEAKLNVPDWCLVRFFDADVEPGKTYVYGVQVRVLNPNFQKQDVVAFEKLAEVKELQSAWLVVPRVVNIPLEWDYYAVDQYALDPEARKQPARGADGPKSPQALKFAANRQEWVAVQIHKWLEKFEHKQRLTYPPEEGDWVVLERALLRRGEPIARKEVEVELPEWVDVQSKFELVGGGQRSTSKKVSKDAISMDFSPPSGEPPVVVDFSGGAKVYYTFPGRSYVVDDSAVELLVLSPDGKLQLRNSGEDSGTETTRGKDRDRQYEHWQHRLQSLNPEWRSATTTSGEKR